MPDNLCILFPFELGWGENKPVAQIARIEWLLEKYTGNVTIIESYLRKEYCADHVSYAQKVGLPGHYKIISTGKYLSSQKAQIAAIPAVIRLLKEIKPSIIWSIKPIPISTLPIWLYRLLNPCTWIADCDDWEGMTGTTNIYSPIYKYYNYFEKFVYNKADIITAASKALAGNISRLSPSAKIKYVPNWPTKKMLNYLSSENTAQNKSSLGLEEGTPVILYIGNIYKDAISDIHVLAAVAQKLKNMKATWLIVGGGQCLQEAKDYIEQQGLRDKFEFVGAKPWTEVVDYLRIADIVVYLREDTPLQRARSPIKMLEYISAGKAIVASEVGEAKELVSNMFTGILVPPNDITAASKAISLLLDDRLLREKLGRAARLAAEKMNSNNNALSFFEEGI